MKRMIVMLMAMLCVAGFANAQTVSVNNDIQAITFDLSNTDWFEKDGNTNVSSVGLSLYHLDTVGTFGSFMRVNTKFDDLNKMFQQNQHIVLCMVRQ